MLKDKKIAALLIAVPLVLAALLFILRISFWWSYALWTFVPMSLFVFAVKYVRDKLPLLVLLYVVILLLCILFPNTGDDWLREPLGRSIYGIRDLIREVSVRWSSTNSRISGNVLAYTAASRKVLRELMRSTIIFGIIIFAKKAAGFRSFWGLLLTFSAIIALPQDLFRQAYPWAAGFFNYVPPVLLFLVCMYLVREIFEDRDIPASFMRSAAVFLLGFVSQLFIETYTICFIAAGFVLLLWYAVRKRKLSPVLLCLCVGNVLGGVLLFSSPAYSASSLSSGAYHMDSSLHGLINTAIAQLPDVLRYLILDCPVLYVSLTIIPVFCMARAKKKTAVDFIVAALLILPCIYFSLWDTSVFSLYVNFGTVVIWLLALAAGILRWTHRAYRLRALFTLICALIAAAPLPFISPIGMRCLYLSYVLMLITAGNMISSLGFSSIPKLTACIISLGSAAILGFYLYIFVPTAITENVRSKTLEIAISSGQNYVEIPAYPFEDYLWEPITDKIQQTYYREIPGDLTVVTVK